MLPPRLTNRAWPLVLAAIAAMTTMVVAAARARHEADTANRSQALVEHVRFRSAQLDQLKLQSAVALRVEHRSALEVVPGATARGFAIFSDLSRRLHELNGIHPDEHSRRLQRDARAMYDAGARALAVSRLSADGDQGFTPALRRLEADVGRTMGEEHEAAARASRRADLAFYAALIGDLLTLMLLTLWLERARRRSATAEAQRIVERQTDERVRALVEQGSEVITVVDEDLVVRWKAGSARRLLGLEPGTIIGRSLRELLHPDDAERFAAEVGAVAEIGRPATVVARLRHAGGRWVHVETIISDRREDPAIQGLLLSMRDVSERMALEDRLRHQAFHDALTGLANRALFEQRLGAALDAGSEDGKAAVLFVDLDDFKTINDSLGHAAGDALLRTVAARVAGVLRPTDMAARLGGDEFAVLLPSVPDERAALAVAERMADALGTDVEVEGRRLAVRASIGVALDDGAGSVDDLLRNADIAMYGAKEQGGGAVWVFEPGLHERAMDRLELSADLPHAIMRGELELDYQPIVTLADGGIAGVEALVRWAHPTRGRLSPLHFISLAEETGAIGALGLWVLLQACGDVRALQEATGRGDLYVSVNVSTKQLHDRTFPDAVADVLAQTGLPARALVLELTESLLVHDRDAIITQLRRLKDLGLRLAVDDFGTGYSVLSYLQEFPVDVLKIDKSFVDDIHRQPDKAKLVEGIVGLSESLRLEVVAEGIELDEQAERLRAIRSPLGQGYLFSRPVPVADIEAQLLSAAGTSGRSAP
jgi:diguanylate cyclase (GGDEF)-like protein/PAS domain S-box-containing protein